MTPLRTLAASIGLLGLFLIGAAPAPLRAAEPRVSPRAAELLAAALTLADERWDEETGFLWGSPAGTVGRRHNSRATAWYAVALMLRDGPGDRERSLRALRSAAGCQYDEPAADWHGTFPRAPGQPRPGLSAVMWRDYDPNWRQFIGSVFALVLQAYGDRVPESDRQVLVAAMERAVMGELKQGRLKPTYTNIALMHGYLLAEAGRQTGRPEWIRQAETWMDRVHEAFAVHGTFEEFNSPTYYGVDFYGLALLRRYGATPRLQERGATMEAALWRTTAQYYHAGLRNLCGPFDRTYGMDMTRYVSLAGVWIGLAVAPEITPLPPIGPAMPHGHDFFLVPCFALLGIAVPDDVRPHLERFHGERTIRSEIGDGGRRATAWLAEDRMIGGEVTGKARRVTPDGQFRPATVHWRLPDGGVGWMALVESGGVDAVAEPHRLTLRTEGNCRFRLHAPGATRASIRADRWELPGLSLGVRADAREWAASQQGDVLEVELRDVREIVVDLLPAMTGERTATVQPRNP